MLAVDVLKFLRCVPHLGLADFLLSFVCRLGLADFLLM